MSSSTYCFIIIYYEISCAILVHIACLLKHSELSLSWWLDKAQSPVATHQLMQCCVCELCDTFSFKTFRWLEPTFRLKFLFVKFNIAAGTFNKMTIHPLACEQWFNSWSGWTRMAKYWVLWCYVGSSPVADGYSLMINLYFYFIPVQWPPFVDYDKPSASGIEGARNLSIEYYSKVDKCPIKIGEFSTR